MVTFRLRIQPFYCSFKNFDTKAINFESSFPSSTGGSNSTLSPTSFFLSLDSSFGYISKISRNLISSSCFILFKSFASLIVVSLYANLGGKDLRAFFKILYFGIFSPRENNSLAVTQFSVKVIDSLLLTHQKVFELCCKQF